MRHAGWHGSLAVDAKKIGLVGQSLGGQVVLSAAALDSVVKATIAYFPITDFRLWGVTTSLNDSIKSDYIYGMCTSEGRPEDRSPLTTSEKIKGAVLLQHGDVDHNVILAHSQLMRQKMVEAGQDVTLYVAKGGAHGSGGPGWENHINRSFAFFRQKLKGGVTKAK